MPAEPPHILHVFATFVPAGPQTRTTALINAFGAAYRHTIVAMDNRTSAQELIAPGVRFDVREAPAKGPLFKTLKALRARIADTRPDLICTYNWGSIETLMAAPRGMPLIHHEEGFGPEEAQGFKLRRIWTRRLVFRRLHALVVPSHNLGGIAKRLWRVPDPRLHVIPNGVDLAHFAPSPEREAAAAALRAELDIPRNAFVVGSVGHLRAEKNYARLIEAVHQAANQRPELDWSLLLVGDGVERAALADQAAHLMVPNLRVHFAGHRDDCAPAYALMDVFSLSSNTEQMPISLVEAMASGKPAVCTNVGDIARMVPPSEADLIAPLSAGAAGLAERFAQLAPNPDRITSAGSAALLKAKADYSFEAMRATYAALMTRSLA